MKKIHGETYWKIGQKVKYKLSDGDRVCIIIASTPYNEDNNSHYVTLIDVLTGHELFSAYDKNLEIIK